MPFAGSDTLVMAVHFQLGSILTSKQRVHAWMYAEPMHARVHEWMDGWMDGWVDGWMDG